MSGKDFFTGLSSNPKAVRMRERRKRVKFRALQAYSGEEPCCHECGEFDPDKLCLEAATDDMRKIKQDNDIIGGTKLYAMLQAAGYPSGFRVTCTSCLARWAGMHVGNKNNPFLSMKRTAKS